MSRLLVPILLMLAIPVLAQYPGPDSIGIYDDDDATEEVLAGCTLPPFTEKRLYLCITNPSGPQVYVFEGRVRLQTNAPYFAHRRLADNGINVGEGDDYLIGWNPPLLPNAQNVVVLMTIDIVFTVDDVARFYVEPVPDSASFEDSAGYAYDVDALVPLGNSTGGHEIPVFVINGQTPLSGTHLSWGGVKRLYD